MPDLPDWQPYADLVTAITNLQAAIDALRSGYGQTATGFALASPATGFSTAGNALVIAGVPGKQIVLLAASFVWEALSSLPRPRGEWMPALYDASTSDSIAGATLSPDGKLSDFQEFPNGACTVTAGAALRVDGTSSLSVPSAAVGTVIAYYYLR